MDIEKGSSNISEFAIKKDKEKVDIKKKGQGQSNAQILDYKLLKIYKSDWFNFHQCQYYRKRAILCATKMKVFTIYGTEGSTIRDSLLRRGWIEKFAPKYLRHLQLQSVESLLEHVEPNNEFERAIISKMTDKFSANFQWNSPISCRYKCLTGIPYTNRIIRERNLDFTNIDGLHKCISKVQKYKIVGCQNVQTPRLHSLTQREDYTEFLRCYRITYCLSLLQFVGKEISTNNIFHEFGTVPLSLIRFATEIVRAKMTYAINSDLNTITEFLCNQEFGDNEWLNFFQSVDNLISSQVKFKETTITECTEYLKECQDVIAEATNHWPLLPWIGYNNLWILKPFGTNQGNGIVIKQNYDDIVNYLQRRFDKRYIIQKYIEKPFLVHNTKFDIHQYILLTVTNTKFSIWVYKDCYLHFSDHQYDLNNLAKIIHIPNNLSNNSINQKKLKSFGTHSKKLPSHNMWSLEQFRTYLNEGRHEDLWYNKIYVDMKKVIVAIILASLDKSRFIPKTFELFRCDFILAENLMPILMEINSSPDMSPTTIITEQLCPAILEDVIRVVIDLPKTKKSSTGQFELVYEYDSNELTSTVV